MQTKTTVAVVEDDRWLREKLLQILENASDIECVASCSSAEEALKLVPQKTPSVVLMDIKLPGMSGIQCVAELKRTMPELLIIILTVYEDSESIFKALKAGANGYLVKSAEPDQLIEAIRDVSSGGAPMAGHIARKVVQHFHLIGPAPEGASNLSPREQQVLSLLASGYIYKEIADKLSIGTSTVRTYVQSICDKMHVRSRLEAVARQMKDAY